MSVVSAHLAGDRVNLSWIPLLAMESHTTIVLMGLSRAEQITSEAVQQGISPALKVAIVSNATSANQSTIITTLGDLERAAKKAPKPAIMIFGDVVALESKLPKYIHEIKETTHDIALSS
jgi:siroheme synthase